MVFEGSYRLVYVFGGFSRIFGVFESSWGFLFFLLQVLGGSQSFFSGSCGFCVFLGGSWRLLKVFEGS